VIGGGYSGDVYQNSLSENPGFSNHWITLRLVGESCNRKAIGARIKVTTTTEDGTQDIYVTVSTGGSFVFEVLPRSLQSDETEMRADEKCSTIRRSSPLEGNSSPKVLRVDLGKPFIHISH